MSDTPLLAALYLEAVLPVLPHLAAHDAPLATALAGPDVAVTLLAPGALRCRLAVAANIATVTPAPRSGDLRLWFPTAQQVVRAFDGQGRTALALPLSGFHRLLRARRLRLVLRETGVELGALRVGEHDDAAHLFFRLLDLLFGRAAALVREERDAAVEARGIGERLEKRRALLRLAGQEALELPLLQEHGPADTLEVEAGQLGESISRFAHLVWRS